VAIYHYSGPTLPLYTNPAFRAMFGLEAVSDIEAWIAAIHPEDRARVRVEWTAFEAELTTLVGEFRTQYRVMDASGSSRVVLERVVRAIGIPGFVGTITDVTELVQTQLELERTHQALMGASHQAGMAEVATNVLHNVGNALNSINVSANLLEARLRQIRVGGLSRVADLLGQQGSNLGVFMASERGQGLPGYLARFAAELLTDQQEALRELGSLVENLEHIKTIVRMQQSHATQRSLVESVAVDGLVNESVRLNAAAFSRHGVTLKLDFAAVQPITVDKHRVLQILVNLISNAKYACHESQRADKCVTIQTRATPLGVAIAVIDNGVGIPAENLTRIFNHGFTTRPGGHGFGLHSAALTAQELKGSLRAASDGAGHGATFTLELPLEPPKRSS
jgi:PAS domain S-box-containing protein